MVIQGHVSNDPHDVSLHFGAVLVELVESLQQLQAPACFNVVTVGGYLAQLTELGYTAPFPSHLRSAAILRALSFLLSFHTTAGSQQ